jgi:hypothetical protein
MSSGARPPEIPQAARIKARAAAPRTEGSQNQGSSRAPEVAASRESRRRCAAVATHATHASFRRHRTLRRRAFVSRRTRFQDVRDAALKSHMMAHGSQQNVREPTKRAEPHRIFSPHCRQRRPESSRGTR